jgi:signal transduction histidine kinase
VNSRFTLETAAPPGAFPGLTEALETGQVVHPDMPLPDCLAALACSPLGLLVVVDETKRAPVGLVDARAVLSRLLQNTPANQVRHVMRPCDELVIGPAANSELLARLEATGIPYLIVVDEAREYQGVVTHAALLKQRRLRQREYVQRLEVTLDQMRQEARQMQEENAELLSVLAHDLRGPLGGILGLAQMVAQDTKPPDPAQCAEYFQIVAREIGDLLKLTNEVLDFTRHRRRAPLEITTCRPDDLLRNVCQLFQNMAKLKGVLFEVRPSPAPMPSILADMQRLQTVLANLLDNAVKYCAPGEKVAIWLENAPHRVVFVVSDNGQGLPQEELVQLFQRFRRGSSRPTCGEPSTGLGLAIAKEIVDAHGGIITVEGDKGKGLTFRVALPVHDHAPAENAAS